MHMISRAAIVCVVVFAGSVHAQNWRGAGEALGNSMEGIGAAMMQNSLQQERERQLMEQRNQHERQMLEMQLQHERAMMREQRPPPPQGSIEAKGCVLPETKVGDIWVRRSDGRKATVTALFGASDTCKDPARPIDAKLVYQ
jgi:hypothetical protein